MSVFKVCEAIPCPVLTKLPFSHPVIRGAARIRGQAISILIYRWALAANR
ncbi:MAG: hypothetical protein MUQ51_01680 [Pseudomonadota bacterium]|nr:hypothetical protein [Pseudomonadota bacterium]MDO7710322.1 hypothetical protein [Pseudomonadota bacterium]